MRPLVAHCHVGLGELYRRTGQLKHGRSNLGAAATMYRDMDMTFFLRQADITDGDDIKPGLRPRQKPSAPASSKSR